MYNNGGTIKALLDKVTKQEYILPAIQREFVWKPEQICKLFDSLMQGYPFGTFLFWKIEPEYRNTYQFYDFVREYHERDMYHCEQLEELPNRELTAVLDGQQRITALNIALRGSYAWKMPGKWWSSDGAFPVRRLYLNLLGEGDEESGSVYQFEFLSPEKAADQRNDTVWYKVSDILKMEDTYELSMWMADQDLNSDQQKQAGKVLFDLHKTIHSKDVISYYEETEQDLARVLNIFIRMNSGGTPLSYSDLLLSVAVSQWQERNARDEIHSLVDEMKQIGDGFNFTKDLVLKAGLMLSDIGSVGFKVENFNKENMQKLERNWDAIRQTLLLATRLLATFGFNSQNLRADSAILPVAYYLYHRNLNDDYLAKAQYSEDRNSLRLWLIRSMLKASGIWGSGLDTLLTSLREIIKLEGEHGFPRESIERDMMRRGKSLSFSEEELDELTELEFGNKRTFALLSLIFHGFDFSQHFHVDHVFPISRFAPGRLGKAGIEQENHESWKQMANQLPNLQLLVGSLNNEKRSKLPHEWLAYFMPDEHARISYQHTQLLQELPDTIIEFEGFYSWRKQQLRDRIAQKLAL
ncbi:DUF262 domain-containing protein [Pelagibaculum spongiae]|uniref:GmrSD restriction endonucleases N-terminal domain-containing protein n=1 Tax=Pelagibaculum spongiae TaxID=2080658 RepID=A0A2V1GR43_9GAMM|nr:DUF262 domain-containing protein [Pelagibaculum spongiae]PVZ66779.1 hypothetical protein DC094_16070 [Pelagibaculum spongiae]